ncbi:PREDICTED: uncharacterized protein LOC109209877 isoform X2 [Nicotiana attenuata]|uniref:uncharacterized protein LOC109209877 isoform X2 n=2 Tax=Nicotiana attenuata TaxID=49451 RepID=UPI0009048510|nr:PREDICTED: uncharacterized protein LOC109209877 isoform X2 [Nicotiana attenuata]
MFRSKLGEINAQLRKEGGLRSILSSSLLWSNHFGLGGVVDSSSLFLWIWYTDKINMDKIESRVADLVKQHDSMYKDFLRKGNIAECEAVKAALLSYPKISVKLVTKSFVGLCVGCQFVISCPSSSCSSTNWYEFIGGGNCGSTIYSEAAVMLEGCCPLSTSIIGCRTSC